MEVNCYPKALIHIITYDKSNGHVIINNFYTVDQFTIVGIMN